MLLEKCHCLLVARALKALLNLLLWPAGARAGKGAEGRLSTAAWITCSMQIRQVGWHFAAQLFFDRVQDVAASREHRRHSPKCTGWLFPKSALEKARMRAILPMKPASRARMEHSVLAIGCCEVQRARKGGMKVGWKRQTAQQSRAFKERLPIVFMLFGPDP